MKKYTTFVYPLDVIAIPLLFLSIFIFGIIAMAIEDVLDIYMVFWLSLITICPLSLLVWFERQIYEIVCIDSDGIHTVNISFLWNDTCYKGVCVAQIGKIEHQKCLYFSNEPITNKAQIMLKRNRKSTIVFPLNKKSKKALPLKFIMSFGMILNIKIYINN